MGKERTITFRVEEQPFRRFTALVALNGMTIASVLRAYMEQYTAENAHLFTSEARGEGGEGRQNEGAVGSAALGKHDCPGA